MEQQVLDANPLLEAFGNAKTLKNDNSSRFGKLIEVSFKKEAGRHSYIVGCKITNYLLERSRVVRPPSGERNYHIFYQLLRGVTEELRERLALSDPEDYFFLSQSGCTHIGGVDDKEKFQETQHCMETIGITQEEQNHIFTVLSAVLHLGNIEFVDTAEEKIIEIVNPSTVTLVCHFLGVEQSHFEDSCRVKQRIVGGEIIQTPLSAEEAKDRRDALAKALYSKLFDWLVTRLNETIVGNSKKFQKLPFIGLLDIFGFEVFEDNSFEQFCINYANEKLQQHFNRHMFKMEQEEYLNEGIDWSVISFNDNQPCLDLIESMPMNILSLLDEEILMPNGSDITFLNKICSQHGGARGADPNPYFIKSSFAHDHRFGIKHYAGDVMYSVEGFLDKNTDSLNEQLSALIESSSNNWVVNLFHSYSARALAAVETSTDKKSGKTGRKGALQSPTVGSQFKAQLNMLMEILSTTSAWFVRCIKPNNQKLPQLFESWDALRQLRYAGMMESIRIRKQGFSLRENHESFFQHYRCLHKQATDCRSLVSSLALELGVDSSQWQMGNTKVFLREDLSSLLNARLKEIWTQASTNISRVWRSYSARQAFKKAKKMALLVQTIWRAHRVLRQFRRKKMAALVLQSKWRQIRAMKYLLLHRHATILIQKIFRGHAWYLRYQTIHKGLIRLQAVYRGAKSRQESRNAQRLKLMRECRDAIRKSIESTLSIEQSALSIEKVETFLNRLRQVPEQWSSEDCVSMVHQLVYFVLAYRFGNFDPSQESEASESEIIKAWKVWEQNLVDDAFQSQVLLDQKFDLSRMHFLTNQIIAWKNAAALAVNLTWENKNSPKQAFGLDIDKKRDDPVELASRSELLQSEIGTKEDDTLKPNQVEQNSDNSNTKARLDVDRHETANIVSKQEIEVSKQNDSISPNNGSMLTNDERRELEGLRIIVKQLEQNNQSQNLNIDERVADLNTNIFVDAPKEIEFNDAMDAKPDYKSDIPQNQLFQLDALRKENEKLQEEIKVVIIILKKIFLKERKLKKKKK